MKKSGFLILMFLGLFAVAGVTSAADPRTQKGSSPLLDSNGNLAAPGSTINPKTGRAYTQEELQRMSAVEKEEALRVKRAAEEAARQEAERLRQYEAAHPRCSGYTYVGPNAPTERINGGNYQCPKGYGCHWNGPLLECRALEITPNSGQFLSADTVVRQEDSRLCKTSFCGSPENGNQQNNQ